MQNLVDPSIMMQYVKEFGKEIEKETNKELRNLFGKYIKGSFLIDVKYLVLQSFPDIHKYYDLQMNAKNRILGTNAGELEYDVCRNIVGCHSSNIIFLDETERIDLERNQDYKRKLANSVIENIKLRAYGSVFFRRKPFVEGEFFISHTVPYNLFVMAIRMSEILGKKGKDSEYFPFYSLISNKALAVLSLLEDNMLDNCYPICRGILEVFLKLVMFRDYPEIITKYYEFSEFELRQSCCDQKYPSEFIECFDKRKNKSSNKRVDYLHYGWLDSISDYHLIVKKYPYSVNGILDFLTVKHEEDAEFYETLKIMYKMCNGYVHGNVASSKYPLLHYFEVSIILHYVIMKTYFWLCDDFENDTNIMGIDILSKTEEAGLLLVDQYNKRTTENFENHYKRYK